MRDDRVEAGSLADLNLLAANPPRYPVNPTDEPREPLTLYISRVPGTRDVILSTLKPQRKNVTSEDVANALYYVHLDLPSDGLLVAPQTVAAAAAAGPTAPTVARKPVPSPAPRPAPRPTPADIPAVVVPPTSTAPPEAPPAPPPHRELVSPRAPMPWVPPGFRLDEGHSFDAAPPASAHDTLPSQQQQQQQQPPPAVQPFPATSTLPIRSRPLPGRTVPGNSSSNGPPPVGPPQGTPGTSPAIPRKPVGPRPDSFDASGGGVPLRPHDKVLPQVPAAQAQPRSSQQQPPPAPSRIQSSTPSNFVPFQLTLIRRDPSTSHQWNIGKIASVQAVDAPDDDPAAASSESTPTPPPPKEQPSIRIRLETSGYAKFRGDDGDTAFARHVVMAYTKSWTAGLRNALKRPSHSHARSSSADGAAAFGGGVGPTGYGPDDLEPPRRFLRPRNHSLVATADAPANPRRSIDSGGGRRHRSTSPSKSAAAPAALITRPGPGLKPKGYSFTSPWDGRCDFRTGNGGRSLKCRHILHPAATDGTTGGGGGGVAGYNPLVIAQSFRDGPGQGLAAVAAATSSVVGGGADGGGRARASSLTSALTGAVAVSELRFNLPRGELMRRPRAGRDDSEEGAPERAREGRGGDRSGGGGARADQLYGRFQDHLHHWQQQHARRRGSSTAEDAEDAEDDDDDDDDDVDLGDGDHNEDDELDLRLGREKAGGGNRGKRAKLGKLIVYDDGFKMLDLVVAANMGVWWVSWERSF
ncbi:hypothetical protein SPBR_04126 [Sporothrix brasiliensis 5110]|uniref:Oxidoreductase-like protein n=1 Tax=Sporothrix brasiliensis 5110 TaxID=1398154 RepID=A0A0C2IW37_9PEZI|nr:uncharacterized protein SPBR_04126 [Sporothrix brasiliensis 5110]KIH93371.1 hypothetical protein SPBR_04126 [Sporothrix brasiliensis 5110]